MTDRPLYDAPVPDHRYDHQYTRRPRDADTWAAARQLYCEGASGQEVRERYGIGRSAFYERMKREGWRRRDQLEDGLKDDPVEARLGERRAADLAIDAWDLLCRAIDRGRLHEARGWGRLFMDMRELARRQQRDGLVMVRIEGGDPDSPDSLFLPPEGEADLTDLTDSFSESVRLKEETAR